jgi:hypothetical protein
MERKNANIAVSLQYGRLLSKAVIVFFYFFIVISLFFTAFVVFLCVFEGLICILLGIVPCLFFSVAIYFLIYDKKLKSKIKIWFKDMIMLEATTKTVAQYKDFPFSIGADNKKKIKVIFKFNGKTITKISGEPGYTEEKYNTRSGYDSIFRKYADKKVSILYSEKYDQVLILNRPKI